VVWRPSLLLDPPESRDVKALTWEDGNMVDLGFFSQGVEAFWKPEEVHRDLVDVKFFKNTHIKVLGVDRRD
jgi:hypothetical protein